MAPSRPTGFRDALAAWGEIREHLADADHIHILSDFDGTLSPLVEIPAAAGIDSDVQMVLRRLCTHKRVTVAVLSGRAVDDVEARIELPLIYAGDHGVEIRGPGFAFTAPGSEWVRDELPGVCERVRENTRHIPGVLLESTRFTANVHIRDVAPDRVPELHRAMCACVDQRTYEVRSGRFVWEIRPRLQWDKGDAARWILHRYHGSQQHTICLGDDCTDAEMFHRLPRAVNIQVGFDGSDLGAQYWLPQGDVARFLLHLLTFVSEQPRRGVPKRMSAAALGGTR
jgi:trehalose 6-phosphate phosphatase